MLHKRLSLQSFLLTCWLFHSGAVAAAAETIQLTRENQTFTLPVLINGAMRLHFMLDTGADGVMIPAEVLATLIHSRTVEEGDVQLGDAVYTLADGSQVKYQKIRLKSLQVGNFEVQNLEASVGPPGSSLLLGGSFTNRLGKWSLDPQAATLTFEAQSTATGYNDEGNRLLEAGDNEAAVMAYTRSLELQADDANVLYNRATSYNNLGNYELALADIRKAVQIEPSDALNHFRKGDIEDNLERYSEALSSYSTALRIDPSHADSWAYRGYTYYKMEKTAQARKDFDQALKLDSDNYLARRWRGQQFWDAKNYQSALDDFQNILKNYPKDYEVLLLRGRCYFLLDKNDAALPDFTACIEHDPKEPAARILRALIYMDSDQLQPALDDFNAGIEAGSENWVAYLYRGKTLQRLRRPREEILRDYRQALRLATSKESKKTVQEAIDSVLK